MHIPFKTLLISAALLVSHSAVHAKDPKDTHAWNCNNNHQLKTIGDGAGNIGLVWNSKTYEMKREVSLPGSLRYKNTNSGFDLVVLVTKQCCSTLKLVCALPIPAKQQK